MSFLITSCISELSKITNFLRTGVRYYSKKLFFFSKLLLVANNFRVISIVESVDVRFFYYNQFWRNIQKEKQTFTQKRYLLYKRKYYPVKCIFECFITLTTYKSISKDSYSLIQKQILIKFEGKLSLGRVRHQILLIS